MRKSILVASLATVLASVSVSADDKPAKFKRLSIPESAKTALEKSASLELYSLDPEEGYKNKDGFRGWKVLGKTVVKDEKHLKELVAAIITGNEKSDGRIVRCFEPRHGIRVVRDGKSVDFVICFACAQTQVYGPGDESGIFANTNYAEELLNKTLKEAKVPLPKPAM